MTSHDRFTDAQVRVKALTRSPSTDQLLELYGLYKQSSVGDVSGKRPGFLDLKGQAKYDAWSRCKGMSSDKAMEAYVALVDKLTAV